MLKEDLERFYEIHGKTGSKKIRLFLRNQGFQGVLIFRFGHWLLKQNFFLRILLKIPYVFLNHRLKSKWGIDIDAHTRIGKGFMIYHYGGIFIGGEAVIGDNFSIGHDVTIGVAGKGSFRGVPVIGDNVIVSAGASIHGKIKIGNNVTIGANAVVDKNIPDYALVQMPAMRIVKFPTFYANKSKSSNTNIAEE